MDERGLPTSESPPFYSFLSGMHMKLFFQEWSANRHWQENHILFWYFLKNLKWDFFSIQSPGTTSYADSTSVKEGVSNASVLSHMKSAYVPHVRRGKQEVPHKTWQGAMHPLWECFQTDI